MSKYTEFDKKEIYEDFVEEKILELVRLCNQHKLPFFMTVAVANDDNHTEYKSNMYASATNDIMLSEDHFPKHVNVLNGFETVPKRKLSEIDFE